MPRIDVRGLGTNVQRLSAPPGAPVVVLVHGLLTDSLASYYFTLAPTLAAAGLDVVMYDLRGHGRTDRPAAGYQLERFVADLDGLLDCLDVRSPVHLVGNSFGGTIAFGFAAAHLHRARSLLMIEGEPATAAWSAKMAANLRRAKDDLVQAGAQEWLTEHYDAHTARLARNAARVLNTTAMSTDIPASQTLTDERIRAVACPVLAVYGDLSDLAEQAPRLSADLNGCRTVIIPGEEHSVLIDQPDMVGDLVLGWVGEHSGVAGVAG